jgi:small subunit ribosomal protein S6
MRRYETFIIIDPDLSEEQRKPLLDRVRETIAQMGGFLIREDPWGSRRLAYAIRKKERGFYVRFDFCGSGQLVNEMERFFRIDERVLKYMSVLLDKAPDLEKIKEEMAKAEQEAAKAAEPEAVKPAEPAAAPPSAEGAPAAAAAPASAEAQPSAPVEPQQEA